MAPFTMNVQTSVGADHMVSFALPEAIPEGEVELFVVFVPKEKRKASTLGAFLESGAIGMWSDRDDLPVSEEGFAEYRRRLWARPQE